MAETDDRARFPDFRSCDAPADWWTAPQLPEATPRLLRLGLSAALRRTTVVIPSSRRSGRLHPPTADSDQARSGKRLAALLSSSKVSVPARVRHKLRKSMVCSFVGSQTRAMTIRIHYGSLKTDRQRRVELMPSSRCGPLY